MSRRYTLISSDSHAGASILDYKAYLPREFDDEFDAWAATFTDGWGAYDLEMADVKDDEFLRFGPSSFLSPYNWDSDKRLSHMDADGVAAEVLFPNTVPPFFPSGIASAPSPSTEDEYRHRWAGVKAHNRWLVDFCAQAPGRRGGIAQVFLNDLDDAINEVRWAKESGLVGVLVPYDHISKLINLYEVRLDPFWRVCSELDMPVHRHTFTVGMPETPESGPGASAIGIYESQAFMRRPIAHLIFGGVFKRHPQLKFVLTETNLQWLPVELNQIEIACQLGANKGDVMYPALHRSVEQLEMSPTEYFRRNCYLGASLMLPSDVEMRHQIGIDHIMWGSDYPHHEGTWPYTRLGLRVNFAGVPEDDVRAMTSINAAQLYGFDLEALQSIADNIGPTVEEVAKPVSANELPLHSMSVTIAGALGTTFSGSL